MSTKYRFGEPQVPHFVSFAVVDWVDVFTGKEYRDIFLDSLRFCIWNKGLILNAWILMTNHVHLIMKAEEGFMPGHILRDLKKFTSVQLREAIQKNSKESRKEWMLYWFSRAGEHNSNNGSISVLATGQSSDRIEYAAYAFIELRLFYIYIPYGRDLCARLTNSSTAVELITMGTRKV